MVLGPFGLDACVQQKACTQIVYTLAPKSLYGDYFKAKSLYYLGTWTLRVWASQETDAAPREPTTLKECRVDDLYVKLYSLTTGYRAC